MTENFASAPGYAAISSTRDSTRSVGTRSRRTARPEAQLIRLQPTKGCSEGCESGERLGVRLHHVARRMERILHHHGDPDPAAAKRGDGAHRSDEVRRAVPRGVVGGFHRPGEDDGPIGAQHEVEQVGGLFERVGPMRDDGADELTVFQPRIEEACELEHPLRAPVRPGQPIEVLAGHPREGGKLRDLLEDLATAPSGHGAATRDDLHGDRPTGEHHEDRRHVGHAAANYKGLRPGANSSQPLCRSLRLSRRSPRPR
jgi:hypothetical protein